MKKCKVLAIENALLFVLRSLYPVNFQPTDTLSLEPFYKFTFQEHICFIRKYFTIFAILRAAR